MLLAIPVVLFPALAHEVFERPELLGLLYSAETVGALVATALSGWVGRVHHHGRAIVIAASLYGAFIAMAGLMPSFWLACGFLALAGAADMVSAVFRATVWNQTIPDTMRGRLAGGWAALRDGVTPLGRAVISLGLLALALARLTGLVELGVVSSLCLLLVAVGLAIVLAPSNVRADLALRPHRTSVGVPVHGRLRLVNRWPLAVVLPFRRSV